MPKEYKNIPVPKEVHEKLRLAAFNRHLSIAGMIRKWVKSLKV